jgi:hypothetical protein
MSGELRPGESLEEFLPPPLTPRCARVTHCAICGAVTYIRFSGSDAGEGDPGLHNQWHDRKGLAARIRRALTWR